MYKDVNSGYVGYSRSQRSKEAIEQHEVPKSMINREEIEAMIADNDFSSEDEKFLKTIPIRFWKAQAPSSWHHTSEYYNMTDHYNLADIAEDFVEHKDRVAIEIRIFKYEKLIEKYTTTKIEIVTYAHDIWGGTRKHPHVLKTEYGYGVKLKGKERIYPIKCDKPCFDKNYYEYSSCGQDKFQSFQDLIKKYPEFKKTKPALNNKIDELGWGRTEDNESKKKLAKYQELYDKAIADQEAFEAKIEAKKKAEALIKTKKDQQRADKLAKIIKTQCKKIKPNSKMCIIKVKDNYYEDACYLTLVPSALRKEAKELQSIRRNNQNNINFDFNSNNYPVTEIEIPVTEFDLKKLGKKYDLDIMY